MGVLKKIERTAKRRLIGVLSRCLTTQTQSPSWLDEHPPRKILVIRQHNQMGDMLLAVPVFAAIKNRFNGARVGVVTSTLNRDVLQNNPAVDFLYCYDKKNPVSHLSLLRSIRAERFDLVIVLHTVSFSVTSVILALLSGAAVRAGSSSQRFGHSLSTAAFHIELPLPSPEELMQMNETEHNLYPLARLGIHTGDLAPVIVPGSDDREWAARHLAGVRGEGVAIIALHPGAGKRENIWPPERFAAAVNLIGAERQLVVAVVEGPRDKRYAERFQGECRVPTLPVRGRSIGEVAALMRGCDLVLCNDTGVMHVACASGAKTLAVFGPTEPGRWTPKCDNLFVVQAPGGALDRLLPEVVAHEVRRLLL